MKSVCKLFITICAVLLVFAGCQNGMEPPKTTEPVQGQGNFKLVIEGVSLGRTILPSVAMDEFVSYHLVFTAEGQTAVTADWTGNQAKTGEWVVLPVATWDLTVTAFLDAEKTKPVAEGSLKGINIEENDILLESLALKAIVKAETNGFFQWNIKFNEAFTDVKMIITPLNNDGEPVAANARTVIFASADSGTTLAALDNSENPLELATGYYHVLFSLGNGTDKAGLEEYLHIYQSLVSTYDRIFTKDIFGGDPTSLVVDHTKPTSLVLTFPSPVTVSNSSGFSLSGIDSETPTTFTLVSDVIGSATDTLTFTLDRKPRLNETVTLDYKQIDGNLKVYSDSVTDYLMPLASFNLPVSLTGFTAEHYVAPAVTTAEINATSSGGFTEDDAKKLYVTFSEDVTFSSANGLTLFGSDTAKNITAIEALPDDAKTLILTLDNWPSSTEASTFKLHYNEELGNIKDTDYNLLANFEQNVTLTGFDGHNNFDDSPPRIVSVTVEDASRSTARVVFDKAVVLDKEKLSMRVAYWSNVRTALVVAPDDKYEAGTVVRTITSAVSSDDKVWDLTMSEAAKHGEILWFAAQADSVVNKLLPSVQLPTAVSRFIVKNLVKRVRQSFEAAAGFYKYNSSNPSAVETLQSVDGTNNNTLYDRSFVAEYFGGQSAGNTPNTLDEKHPKAGDVYTLVIDSDQRITKNALFNSWSNAQELQIASEGAIIIITTTTGNTKDYKLTIANDGAQLYPPGHNHTLILDEHIIVERELQTPLASNTTAGQLIWVREGGKLILDGAVLQNNQVRSTAGNKAGAIFLDSGAAHAFILMNNGKITGNHLREEGNTLGSGAIAMNGFGTMVMHDGEISGNTHELAGTLAQGKAGAVNINNNGGAFGLVNFYMTGGTIKGNKVTGSGGNFVGAGGVLVSGNFQKVGGTIYGSDITDASLVNSTVMTGNVNAGAIVVMPYQSGGNPTAASVYRRDTTSSPDNILIIHSDRSGGGNGSGKWAKPAWAQDNWDK